MLLRNPGALGSEIRLASLESFRSNDPEELLEGLLFITPTDNRRINVEKFYLAPFRAVNFWEGKNASGKERNFCGLLPQSRLNLMECKLSKFAVFASFRFRVEFSAEIARILMV